MSARGALFAALTILGCVTGDVRAQQRATPVQRASPPPNITPLSAKDVYKLVSPSVFIVESLDANGKVIATGSGVAVTADSIVTNHHVVQNGVRLRITHGEVSWSAIVTHDDTVHDICKLQVTGLKAKPVSVGRIAKVEIGQRVYAVGAPEGLELSISEGIVSGLRHVPTGDLIQMTAAISRGSSGGGLFDTSGRLIGLTTSYIQDGQNLNFAIPADLLSRLDSFAAKSPTQETDPAFQAEVLIFYGLELMKRRKPDAKLDNDTASTILAAFVRAHLLEPDWTEPYMGIGLVDIDLEEWEAAAKAFSNVVRLKPNDETAWYLLGLQYQELGKSDDAIAAHSTAIRLKPDYCDPWVRLAAIHFFRNEYSDFLEAYIHVKELSKTQGPSCEEAEKLYRGFIVQRPGGAKPQ